MGRWRVGLVLVAVFLGSCRCHRPAEPLRVGVLVWPPYELAYLARDLGYLEDGSIQLVDYLSPAEAARAYRNRLVDVVAMTTSYALQFAAQDTDAPKVVLVIDISMGGDALLVRPGPGDPRDLSGKRIGAEQSALGVYVLDRAMTRLGADRDDVQVVSVDVADQKQAFIAGDVDAVLTYEPIRSELLAEGAVEIFSSREIPGEIVDVLIARSSTTEKQRDNLQVLIDGWLRATEYLRTHPGEAHRRMARREPLSPEALGRALSGVRIPDRAENRALLGGDAPGLLEPTQTLAERMTELEQLPAVPAVRPLLDARFVERGGR